MHTLYCVCACVFFFSDGPITITILNGVTQSLYFYKGLSYGCALKAHQNEYVGPLITVGFNDSGNQTISIKVKHVSRKALGPLNPIPTHIKLNSWSRTRDASKILTLYLSLTVLTYLIVRVLPSRTSISRPDRSTGVTMCEI
jgi:hypothetical protein